MDLKELKLKRSQRYSDLTFESFFFLYLYSDTQETERELFDMYYDEDFLQGLFDPIRHMIYQYSSDQRTTVLMD